MNNNVLAIILGGGQGTRLFPLTLQRSKPAVPFGGKYRVVDIAVSNCINSDITRIFVLTQFNSASLNRHIARSYRFSNFSDGFVEILAAEQTPENRNWFQGTADAVRQVLVHISDLKPREVLILAGDHLYQMDYRVFLEHHRKTGAEITVSVIPTDMERATGFGLLKTDDEGRIAEFSEKPPADQLPPMRVDTTRFGLSREDAERRCFLASMGVYVFNFNVLCELLENEKHTDFGKQVIPEAIGHRRVQAFLFDGYWEDIGTVSAYYQANLDMIGPVPKFNLFNAAAPIYTHSRFLPASKLVDCHIRNSAISDGCILNRASIEYSIIGIRSRIENDARIDHSLVMGADNYQTLEEMEEERRRGLPRIGIGENTVIHRAIIDKNARIGANVHILNEAGREEYDGDNYFIREGIVVVPKNATIPDGTVI
ncbi:MAG: glucose-1-phosphate adenylyltransferase [Acidobacteria bacterium]|nr:glucose-1-phosphate adenylyltransferase [Acidobacteriota bacterium]